MWKPFRMATTTLSLTSPLLPPENAQHNLLHMLFMCFLVELSPQAAPRNVNLKIFKFFSSKLNIRLELSFSGRFSLVLFSFFRFPIILLFWWQLHPLCSSEKFFKHILVHFSLVSCGIHMYSTRIFECGKAK